MYDRLSLKVGRFEHPAGTTVYKFKGHDYGLCRDDELAHKVPHVAVTLNEDGTGPFFTVPRDHLLAAPLPELGPDSP